MVSIRILHQRSTGSLGSHDVLAAFTGTGNISRAVDGSTALSEVTS